VEEFGEFLVPGLVELYASLISPDWRTLDLIEHVEQSIHVVVRKRDPLAKPPEIVAQRVSPGEVVVTYRSPRKLCSLAKGTIKGVAKRYKEQVEITETSCMLSGAPECKLRVRKIS